MKPQNDIYNTNSQLKRTKKRLVQENISERNKELIENFDRACFMEGLSKIRRLKIMRSLIILAKDFFQCDFDKANKEKVQDVVMQIDGRDEWSAWTKHGYKVILKKFYKWLLFGDEYREKMEYPKVVSWLRTGLPKKDRPRIKASDILTEDEVKKLIDTAEHPRDKAFISMLYELGARIGEMGGLLIRDITKDSYSYLIDLEGKTGHRTPRIVISDPHLTHWLNVHPFKDSLDAPLWVMIGSRKSMKRMRYSAFRALVTRLVDKSGIKKRVYHHLFRHTRVTHLLINRQINEAQAKIYFGWVPNSTVLSEYSHLVSKDVNDAILTMHGITPDKSKESILRPKICPRCSAINAADATFCQKCTSVLDVKTALKLDEERQRSDSLMTMPMKDPQVKEILLKKGLDMGLKNEIMRDIEKQSGK